MKSYYDILGIPKGSSKEEIKKAYYSLAQKWHPDKFENATDEEKKTSEETFKEIAEAYTNLNEGHEYPNDPKSRHVNNNEMADMMRDFARQAGFKFGMGGQDDFFETIIVPVTLKNLYNEENVTVTFNTFDRHEMNVCSHCNGTGQLQQQQQQENFFYTRVTPCSFCQGQGFSKIGMGTVNTQTIKASVSYLHRPYSLGRVGSYNTRTNDKNEVVVRLQIQRASNYDLVENGAGLLMILPVEYEHLRDGKKLKISVFDNKIVVDIPPKPSLHRVLTVQGKGMPLGQGRRGNLYVKLDLKYPE